MGTERLLKLLVSENAGKLYIEQGSGSVYVNSFDIGSFTDRDYAEVIYRLSMANRYSGEVESANLPKDWEHLAYLDEEGRLVPLLTGKGARWL